MYMFTLQGILSSSNSQHSAYSPTVGKYVEQVQVLGVPEQPSSVTLDKAPIQGFNYESSSKVCPIAIFYASPVRFFSVDFATRNFVLSLLCWSIVSKLPCQSLSYGVPWSTLKKCSGLSLSLPLIPWSAACTWSFTFQARLFCHGL